MQWATAHGCVWDYAWCMEIAQRESHQAVVEWTKTQYEDRQLSPNTRGGAMARVSEYLAAWANIDKRVLRVNSGCNNAYVLSPLRVSCAQSCSLALTVKLQRTGGSLFF